MNMFDNPFDRIVKKELEGLRPDDGMLDSKNNIFYIQPIYSRRVDREFGKGKILFIRQEALSCLLGAGVQFINCVFKDYVGESLTSMWVESPTLVFFGGRGDSYIGLHIDRFKRTDCGTYTHYITDIPNVNEDITFIYDYPNNEVN